MLPIPAARQSASALPRPPRPLAANGKASGTVPLGGSWRENIAPEPPDRPRPPLAAVVGRNRPAAWSTRPAILVLQGSRLAMQTMGCVVPVHAAPVTTTVIPNKARTGQLAISMWSRVSSPTSLLGDPRHAVLQAPVICRHP